MSTRSILITGAALRIGRAIACCLAEAGWRVVLHAERSRQSAAELCGFLRSNGAECWCVYGDLSDPGVVQEVFANAVQLAGSLDALINNAAIFTRQLLLECTSDDFARQWQINAATPIQLTLLLARHLHERQATGSVVNLLDQRIARVTAGATPYVLSKKYLEAFTCSAALEFGGLLRVNGVAPGAVLLPTTPNAHEPAGVFPVGKRPEPDDIADATLFLLNATAITGQIIFVDGGQHMVN